MTDTRKSATNATMNFGDALFMMEATFNYYHSFNGETFNQLTNDTSYIAVPYNLTSDIAMDDLSGLFVEINNTIYTQLNNCALENKKPYLFNLNLQATDAGSRIEVISTLGSVSTLKSAMIDYNVPFGTTDYWKPLFKMGKCGAYEGQMEGKDAGTQWNSKLPLKYNHSCCNYYYYFTNIQTVDVYEYNIFLDEVSCFSPNDMNSLFTVFDNILQQHRPTGKTLCTSDVVVQGDASKSWLVKIDIDQPTYGIKKIKEYEQVPTVPTTLP
jgi:hypothetical protein